MAAREVQQAVQKAVRPKPWWDIVFSSAPVSVACAAATYVRPPPHPPMERLAARRINDAKLMQIHAK